MTAAKSLPARPSLESLRKQAKKLVREIAAGETGAIARARAHLPGVGPPLTQRNAQLVLAREYGYSGWKDLVREVKQRLGGGLEWAVSEARRIIHNNDIEGLRRLLVEYPALLSWRTNEDDGGLLGIATGSYGDSFDPSRERIFTRAACAEILVDAGAVIAPSVLDGLISSRTRGLLDLFHRRGLLPRSLKFLAALGNVRDMLARLEQNSDDLAAVNDAFMVACHFQHATVAALLLDRSIALDTGLGKKIQAGPGRSTFAQYITAESETLTFAYAEPAGPWQAYVMRQVVRAVHDGDLASFLAVLRREPWMLEDARVKFQVGLIERAVIRDREPFITALLDLRPALLRTRVPQPPRAVGFAITYAKPHLLPALLRIWPLPGDLPHAAGTGNLAMVKRWFDASGKPALGDPAGHFPEYTAGGRRDLQWGPSTVQQVLDTAFAWAVVNNHFEIADFLLVHGADINTTWSSHEPASLLHELVFHANYEAMQFLIDHGIDMTIKDYRWDSTAQGWARYAAKDEKMAQWLEDAERKQVKLR